MPWIVKDKDGNVLKEYTGDTKRHVINAYERSKGESGDWVHFYRKGYRIEYIKNEDYEKIS